MLHEIKAYVSNPQTEQEGRRDAFTTYLISTDEEQHSVRRRYSDFQWLYSRLLTEFPGAIVPIIPHKVAMMILGKKKFDPQFVEQRRRTLMVFLNTVLNHAEFPTAPSMRAFLVAPLGTEFETARKHVEAVTPTLSSLSSLLSSVEDEPGPTTTTGGVSSTASSSSASRKVSHMLAMASTMIKVRAGKQEWVETAEEDQIVAVQEYISHVSTQVKLLVGTAEQLTQTSLDMSHFFTDLSGPLRDWKQEYQQSRTHGPDQTSQMMEALVEFTSDYSRLMECKHREEQMDFEEVMLRLRCDVKACKVALKQRRQWQVELTTTLQQISAKEEQYAKATLHLKPPDVMEKLSQDRSELQRVADRETAKLEECTHRFLKDITECQQRLELQLKEAFFHYATIQIAYSTRMGTVWNQLLPLVRSDGDADADDNVVNNNNNASLEEEDVVVVPGGGGSGSNLSHNDDSNHQEEGPPPPPPPPPPSTAPPPPPALEELPPPPPPPPTVVEDES